MNNNEQKNKNGNTPTKKKFTLFGDWIYNRNVLIAFSIILSATLWVILTLNVTKETEKVFVDIPIEIYDASLYDQYGLKAIEIVGPDSMMDCKVDITATGGLYALSKVSAEDISVKAVQTGTISEPASYRLTLSVTCNNSDVDVSFADGTSYILVRYDRYTEKSSPIDVTVITNGAAAADGLVVGEAFSNVKSISVKGPETEVNRIASVVLSADVNKTLTATETFPGALTFKDENGVELTEAERSKITVVAYSDGTQEFEGAPTQEELQVQVPIEKVANLPLEVTFKNVPTGFDTSTLSYTLTPSTIRLEGKADVIDKLAESGKYTLESQVDLAALEPLSPSQKLKLSVNSGVSIGDDISEVTVMFNLGGYATKTLTLNNGTAHFRIINGEGMSASIISQKIENVRIVGPVSSLSKLSESDCVVDVDLSSVDSASGQKAVKATVFFRNYNNCWTVGTYTVTVQLG